MYDMHMFFFFSSVVVYVLLFMALWHSEYYGILVIQKSLNAVLWMFGVTDKAALIAIQLE